MSRKTGMSVVEATIVLAILLLIAAISAPALRQNVRKKRAAACAMNLDAIDLACKKHAAEKGGYPSAPPLALRSSTASRMHSASSPHATELMTPRRPLGSLLPVWLSRAPRSICSATLRTVGSARALPT